MPAVDETERRLHFDYIDLAAGMRARLGKVPCTLLPRP
jgi:hypothetical protein